jgi:hypothetical protein
VSLSRPRIRLPFSRRDRDPLRVVAGSPRKRDFYKVATAGFTGVTAFGALTVTGAVAGAAAHQKALDDAAKPVQPPAPPVAQVVTRKRPHHTVVRTKVVHAVSVGVARPSSGGVVRSSTSSSSHSSSGGGATVTHSAPAPKPAAPKPAAPKPAAPAPAPSSGS